MTQQNEELSPEIVIVGGLYGEFSDVVRPLYKAKGNPIAEEIIRQNKGSMEVFLFPVSSKFDRHAVGVYTYDQRHLGYVWTTQSYSVKRWIVEHGCDYMRATLTGVVGQANVLLAESAEEFRPDYEDCWTECYDQRWASGLPSEVPSMAEQSLALGLALLRDTLLTATRWDATLELRIDNVLRQLPLDLSAQ